jgi:hypothetical protein
MADILVGVGLGCLLQIIRNHVVEVKVSSEVAETLGNTFHGDWKERASLQPGHVTEITALVEWAGDLRLWSWAHN